MKVNVEVDNEKIKGLLCCAFEGGSNYWAKIDSCNLPDNLSMNDFGVGGKFQTKNYWHWSQIIPLVEGCSLIIEDQECHTYGEKYILNIQAIHKGLQIMANQYPNHFADFMSQQDDATTGDVFLQCCLFGKVVYG